MISRTDRKTVQNCRDFRCARNAVQKLYRNSIQAITICYSRTVCQILQRKKSKKSQYQFTAICSKSEAYVPVPIPDNRANEST